jgi:response regulator NasT
LQNAIDIVLRRFSEYHALEGAFGRRAVTERAKGMMERHDVDEQMAFQMLRDEARRTHRRIVDLAEAVATTRALLPSRPTVAAEHPPET